MMEKEVMCLSATYESGLESRMVYLSEMRAFLNHPFRVKKDAAMYELMESIRTEGILVPLLIRPIKQEGDYHYEISQEIFDKAQDVIEQRGKEKNVEYETGKYQRRYAFSGKIICGECGSIFKRRQHRKTSGNYIAWTCSRHIEDKEACSMLYITDADIKTAFVRMMRKLEAAQTVVLKPFVDGLKGFNNKERLQQVLALEEKLQKNEEQQTVLINLMSAGYIEPELYHAEKNTLLVEQDKLNKEKQLISKSINGDLTHLDEAQKLLKFVAKHPGETTFQDECFLQFVDTITVKDRGTVVFNLKCGLNLTERLVIK